MCFTFCFRRSSSSSADDVVSTTRKASWRAVIDERPMKHISEFRPFRPPKVDYVEFYVNRKFNTLINCWAEEDEKFVDAFLDQGYKPTKSKSKTSVQNLRFLSLHKVCIFSLISKSVNFQFCSHSFRNSLGSM